MYRALTRWIGSQRWLLPAATLVGPVDRFLLRKFGRRITPFPTLLLTTVGRTSGQTFGAPLWYLQDGSDLTVIASNFGRGEPDWSRNLRVNSTCTVKIRRHTTAHRARLASDSEWEQYFARFADFYPTYRDYVARAGREVPIWVLASAGADGSS